MSTHLFHVVERYADPNKPEWSSKFEQELGRSTVSQVAWQIAMSALQSVSPDCIAYEVCRDTQTPDGIVRGVVAGYRRPNRNAFWTPILPSANYKFGEK